MAIVTIVLLLPPYLRGYLYPVCIPMILYYNFKKCLFVTAQLKPYPKVPSSGNFPTYTPQIVMLPYIEAIMVGVRIEVDLSLRQDAVQNTNKRVLK